MNEKNNFERLLEEYEAQLNQEKQDSIKNGIWGTLGVFKFIGVMVDMYVPKMFQMLIELSGGAEQKNESENDMPMVFGSGFENPEEEEE